MPVRSSKDYSLSGASRPGGGVSDKEKKDTRKKKEDKEGTKIRVASREEIYKREDGWEE